MKQFLSFIQKEFYHVFRDNKTLLMLFGLPITLILLFGFAVTNEVKNAKIMVCDYAKDCASQQIINQLSVNQVFHIENNLQTHLQIEECFKQDDIKLAIVFPINFRKDLLHHNKAEIQIIADGSDPNTATTLIKYATSVIMEYQQSLATTATTPYTILPEVRMLYNPELKGAINFVPGIMALVLVLVCVLMTAVSIVREKETGTMELLLVSPVNPFMVIISKAIPYLLLSIINLSVILILSVNVLGVPINGSLLLLFSESILLIITALSLGLLISNVAKSQEVAMLISMIGMLVPTMLFTGFLFPLDNMPKILQWVSNIFPSKWYYIIIQSVMIKGLGLSAVWKETLILVVMACLLLFVSFKKFKIRLI